MFGVTGDLFVCLPAVIFLKCILILQILRIQSDPQSAPPSLVFPLPLICIGLLRKERKLH